MGTMFKILGLLPDDEVYECSPKDFATGFAEQAGQKTAEIMKKIRGGVLFVDEAYLRILIMKQPGAFLF